MKIKTTPDTVWREYQRGVDYKNAIDLYATVKTNENMYLGRQWEGVNAPDLPKPVLNFLKQIVSHQTAIIVSDDVGISYEPHRPSQKAEIMAAILSKEIERVIEQTKEKSLYRDLIRNASVDGDCSLYYYFDPEAETGQDAVGDIRTEIIENINVLFGNPYVCDVQKQPYIIICQRRTVQDAKEEAQKSGIAEWDTITADEDTNQNEKGDSALCTVLVKLWKENGTIHAMKCTEKVMVSKPRDLGYKLYPLTWMSWEKVKSSYHGQASITSLVQNQISVNRLFAMTVRSAEMNAFPKVAYDSTKIDKWTSRVGEAIAVTGSVNEAISTNLRGADVSSQVMTIINDIVTMTRDFFGASDAALGNVKPDNTSAIIALQQASNAPLELQRKDFHQCVVEDGARIKADIMRADYGARMVVLDDPDIISQMVPPQIDPMTGTQAPPPENAEVMVDFSQLGDMNLQLKVDVGASAYWSEIMQVQTMDAMFRAGIITDAVTYLEHIPDGYIKGKNKLIDELKQQQEQMAQMQPPINTPPGV